MMIEQGHEYYMEKCLQMGEIALSAGNPPVGSIIVSKGRIIGEGVESVKPSGDITCHAEIEAIRDVIQNGFLGELSHSVLYTTHEPCIMCSYVIRHHKISHVVYGVAVDYIGGDTSSFGVLSSERVPQWGEKPEITSGICQEECEQLNLRFRSRR